jgi:hypothetical protein
MNFNTLPIHPIRSSAQEGKGGSQNVTEVAKKGLQKLGLQKLFDKLGTAGASVTIIAGVTVLALAGYAAIKAIRHVGGWVKGLFSRKSEAKERVSSPVPPAEKPAEGTSR